MATEGADGSPQQVGEPPRERWADILENARTKARDEALNEWKGYDWAKQVSPDQFAQMAQWYQQAAADPVTFVQSLIGEMQAHPTYGQQLRSLAARTLASGRGAAAEPTMPEPDVAITDANGQVVGQTYSAAQLAKRDEWLTRRLMTQVMTEVEHKYSPIVKTVEEQARERELVKAQHDASQFATGFYTEMAKLPGFEEHKAAIAQEIRAMRLSSDDPAELKAATYQAYVKLVLPSLTSKAQSQLLDTLDKKAAASTSVNPGSAAPSTPRKVNSFHELGPEAWR